jgi:uncharacterized protein (DUF488 family)
LRPDGAKRELIMARTLYTIGYQGTPAESFLGRLLSVGVETVLDIRELPQSRIPGFSKGALSERLRRNGIDYLHIRELGSPRELRHELRQTNDFAAFTRSFLLYLKKQMEHVQNVKEMAYRRKCCLLCFEKNHDECHRKLVALEIRAVARNGLQIVHL